MSLTPKLKELVRVATTQFRLLNRTKALSAADKKQLKAFFLDQIIAPRVESVLAANREGGSFPGLAPKKQTPSQRLLTVPEVEAWLRINRKTLYAYVKKKLIPHTRMHGNIRFPAKELQQWVNSHSHVPPATRIRPKSSRSHVKRVA